MELPDSIQVVSDKYLQNISNAFKTLYNEEQLSDVTIYCREGSVKAHKLILAASSPYFCKIFRENRNEFPILILHGTSMNQIKNLIDLLYTGITDVKKDDIEALNRLIREFEIKGVNFGQETTSSNVRLEINGSNVSPDSIHNRDTRFKGKKRVAVDYEHDENVPSTSRIDTSENHLPKRSNLENSHIEELNQIKIEAPSPVPTESTIFSMSDVNSISDRSSYTSSSANKISAWAKKQRKFKCHLCPSSFKRSSHLSRHQLVHTGERPYSCNRCDKAFSRVDKLKHHIKKAHEFIPDSMYERIDDVNDSESESSMRNQTSPHQNNTENVYATEYVDLPAPKNSQGSSSPLFTISHISTILEDSFVNPTKKGRGRPRKYPLSTASPTVLNSNQEQPISNCIKVKKKRRSWVDLFISENENKRTSMRLREKTHKNTNEDFMFSQMENKIDTNLMCEICDKPYVYEGKLKTHMKKIHNISDYTVNEPSDFNKRQENNVNTEPQNDNIGEEATLLPNYTHQTIIEESPSVIFLDKDKAQISNQIDFNPDAEEGSRTTEHLSYEQLRRLLPKECSLQPIVVDYDGPGNSEPNKMKVCDSSSSNIEEIDRDEEGSVSISNTLLKSVTYSPVEKRDEKQSVVQSTPTQREFKARRAKKKVGIIKYARARKQKFKDCRHFPEQSDVGPSDADSPPLNDSHIPSLNIPQLNSSIEISLITTDTMNSSPTMSQKEKNDGDLSLTIIDSSENCQQDKNDCVGSKIPIRELKAYLFQNGDQDNRAINNSEECESNVLNYSQLSQYSELQTSDFPQKKKRGRPKKIVGGNSEPTSVFDIKRRRGRPKKISMGNSEQKTDSTLKKKRGRPRKNFKVPPSVKRGRGRPRGQVFSSRPSIQNYNLSNLPYGDLNYLTGQSDLVDEEEESPVIMEPLVEINMDQNEQKEDAETRTDEEIEKKNPIEITRILHSSDTQPVVQILNEGVKEEQTDDANCDENIDISEIENKIGLIGECTISVAN